MIIKFGIKIAPKRNCISLSNMYEDPNELCTLYSDAFKEINTDWH